MLRRNGHIALTLKRRGLSRQLIGEFLGRLLDRVEQVLDRFALVGLS